MRLIHWRGRLVQIIEEDKIADISLDSMNKNLSVEKKELGSHETQRLGVFTTLI